MDRGITYGIFSVFCGYRKAKLSIVGGGIVALRESRGFLVFLITEILQ